MRFKVIIVVLVAGLLVALLFTHETRLTQELDQAKVTNQQLAAQFAGFNERLNLIETRFERWQNHGESFSASASPSGSSGDGPGTNIFTPTSSASRTTTASLPDRLAALESRVRSLSASPSRLSFARAVPEYDPTQPLSAPATEEQITNSAPRRGWSPEQIIGPPDTLSAGDLPTAWASRVPDGGPEWLMAGFDQEVDVAEVRIRETYNPGAIVKVAALVGNQEVVLWEGAASAGPAPRDFVVRATIAIRARAIAVHLDTARVPGWNEIDAIELVGRDGTRQWASSASASSTYADSTSESLRFNPSPLESEH